jgi:hypothetical protein
MAEAEALRLALTATKAPLECLIFRSLSFWDRELFSILVQGIHESRSVHRISLADCIFDVDSTHLLQDFFAQPTNKHYSLDIAGQIRLSKPHDIFFGALLQTNACLTELKFEDFNFNNRYDISTPAAIATALENDASSVLEKLSLHLESSSQFQALVGSLPKMKCLRKLHVHLQDTTDIPVGIPSPIAMLLQALKGNSSLWQVTADLERDWSEAEIKEMEFYAKRNMEIYTILDAPEDKVQLLTLANWPRILRAIRGCEIEASVIFAGLMALGSACGPSSGQFKDSRGSRQGGGKRKQHCSSRP